MQTYFLIVQIAFIIFPVWNIRNQKNRETTEEAIIIVSKEISIMII